MAASTDFTKLQEIITNATQTDASLAQARKKMSQIEALVSDMNTLLTPGYKAEPKVRKPRAEGSSKAGRPRKNADA